MFVPLDIPTPETSTQLLSLHFGIMEYLPSEIFANEGEDVLDEVDGVDMDLINVPFFNFESNWEF